MPEIYYDSRNRDYYVINDRGQWISVNETSAKRHLKAQGFTTHVLENNPLSPMDGCLSLIQTQQDVSYTAPLAGYKAGIYEINNLRILVTDSPRFIETAEGEWPLLQGIFEGMFNEPTCDQRPYFYGWLKNAMTALRNGKWQPGQILALAGAVRSAKSLCQSLITKMLGGRVAHPYQFMTGATTFNADLFAAEHLMIEDVAESINIQKRRHFGAQIKAFSVNREQHCHGKRLTPLTLTPFWRITISLNDDPERLMVLPPMDEDIADKIMLLNVNKRDMPMPTETSDEQSAFWNALLAELPAFLYYLDKWTIPDALRSQRFGIRHYHHPTLLAGLDALSPEQQLLEMIDRCLFTGMTLPEAAWVGMAATLSSTLTEDDCDCRIQARSLLHSNTACGTYLARLHKKYPDRINPRRINGRTEYTIQPPVRDIPDHSKGAI